MDEALIAFTSHDGLRLAAREFPGPPGAGVVLCLHGLTRNSRDFKGLARILSARRTVLAPDQRGRGASAYDPAPSHYNLMTQSQDVWTLLDQQGVDRCVVIGTSMGALMTIVMANTQPDRIAGIVLNDAGPEVDPRGLARIGGYVGKGMPCADWDEAMAALRAVHGSNYPTYTAQDWMGLAQATYRQTPDGGLRPDYDPALITALAANSGVAPDMWPAFDVLRTIPALVIRGALSDILAAQTAAKMEERYAATTLVTIEDRGHAPDLTEAPAVAAIQAFLERPDVTSRWEAGA